MRVVYSDETGTDGKEERNPSTLVTALMLNMDQQWKPVRDAVEEAIVETINPPKGLARFALKGKSIYRQIERGHDDAKALMLCLMAIPQQCSVPVFYSAIHLEGFRYQMKSLRQPSALKDAFRPFRLAFQNCMQKVDTYINARYRDEEVLWIHDAGSLDGVTKDSLRGWRTWVEEAAREIAYMKAGRSVPAEIEPHVSHVADMIYFGNDEESRLLQLVDCCCCTIARHLRGDEVVTPYYAALRGQVVDEGERPLYEDAERMITSIRAHITKSRRIPVKK